MTESAESKLSREQFEHRGNEKAWNLKRRPDGSYDYPFTAYRWDDWKIAWAEAVRDTREQCSQLAISLTKDWRPCECGADDLSWKVKKAGPMYNTPCGHAIDCPMYHAYELAERLRGGI